MGTAQQEHNMERLDAQIDAELARLGYSSITAPDDSGTLDCFDTEIPGIVSLHDTQEVTLVHGLPLLEALRLLKPPLTWEELWYAIVPHME